MSVCSYTVGSGGLLSLVSGSRSTTGEYILLVSDRRESKRCWYLFRY